MASDLQVANEAVQVYFSRRDTFVQDGTGRPIQRPQNQEVQKIYYSGKPVLADRPGKKRHTVKNNVLVNAQAKIAWLSVTCEGKKHDKKIADETSLTLPHDSRLYQDTGFQGFALPSVTTLQPKKKPQGGFLLYWNIAQINNLACCYFKNPKGPFLISHS
jgi:hypothetical protein